MATVSILPISEPNGDRAYRALSGNKYSVGKTAGQALDALVAQLDDGESSALLVIQNFSPDTFFGAEQQARLAELMELWRAARDRGEELSSEQQQELDSLAEAELIAATARTDRLMSPAFS